MKNSKIPRAKLTFQSFFIDLRSLFIALNANSCLNGPMLELRKLL